MAEVRNIKLSVGRGASGMEFAEVSYDVDFAPDETKLDLRFSEWAILFERDDELDAFHRRAGANVGLRWFPRGNPDDFIGYIFKGLIQPNGNSTIHRSHKRDWNFPNNENGNEEYRALVQIIPEITTGGGWSNEVSVNLA